ncbi:uncharacterized protein A4U43_C09F10790 [Asparagus officinalis]|uniref:Uncharacterized protein n=1 Tax=Asparagus officinalis TaxID=4686 RepID=A0A5P1E6P5_ASPOF|nr:uncharacterized protein A4U43_C09F10790 [Asparagus officinalis]
MLPSKESDNTLLAKTRNLRRVRYARDGEAEEEEYGDEDGGGVEVEGAKPDGEGDGGSDSGIFRPREDGRLAGFWVCGGGDDGTTISEEDVEELRGRRRIVDGGVFEEFARERNKGRMKKMAPLDGIIWGRELGDTWQDVRLPFS